MAFHPFRSFQKHRRAWLASVTLLAMVTFIACGSGSLVGDVGGWVQTLLGYSKGTGPETLAAKLYGKKITYADLHALKRQRLIANLYMDSAVGASQADIVQNVYQAASNRNLFDELQQVELQRMIQDRDMRLRLLANIRASQSAMLREFELEARTSARVGVNTLSQLYNDLKEKKPEAAKKVGDLLAVLTTDLWIIDHPRDELYFGGGVGLEDVLDFKIWLHQADKLGIVLTDADVREAFNRETHNRFSGERADAVTQQIAQRVGKFKQEELFQALGDEFRVRLAKATLLGADNGPLSYAPGGAINHEPVAITPYEFWTYYRHNRTAVKVALQPVPVHDFLDQVKETPEEQELRKLFGKHKDQLAAPYRDKPGFKQPRRVQVEWVSGKADTPGRRKEGGRILELTRMASRVTAALVAPAPDGGLAPYAVQGALEVLPTSHDLRVIAQYQDAIESFSLSRQEFQLAPLTNPHFAMGFYTAETKPANVAAAVGLSQANPLGAALGYQAIAYQQEYLKQQPQVVREAGTRIPFGVNVVLSGTSGLPLSTIIPVYVGATEQRYLPLEAVKTQLQARIEERVTRGLLLNALNQLKKDLESKKSKPEEVLAKAIQNHELKHQTTTKPRDPFDVVDDPGLQPLKEAYVRAERADPKAKRFASLFFDAPGKYKPRTYPERMQLDRPLDQLAFESTDEPFLFWRTADEPEFVPPDLKSVRDQVVAAWKFQRARELAKKEAERLAAEAKGRKDQADAAAGAMPFLRDQAAKHPKWGPLFELDNVARLLDKPAFRVAAKQYEPYKVPESFIEYPRPDTVDRLLSLQEVGDTAVLSDRPESIYYVTVLLRRTEPNEQEFYALYRQTPFLDSLRDRLEQERRRDFREAFIKQLRGEAGKVDDAGRLLVELPDDMRKSFEGRGGGDAEE